MIRIVNVRLPVLLACAVATGVGLGYIFISYDISAFYITAVVPITAVIFITAAKFAKSSFPLFCIVLCGTLFIAGAANCFFRFDDGEISVELFILSSIRDAIQNVLYKNLDKDTAAVAYGLITGDTRGVDHTVLTSFRYGGIAHIFAVSGLHIGIIYGIIYSIGKRLKLNKYILGAISLFTVFFYAGVCGFTLSSIRAAIMCAVSCAAKLTCKKYDGLNSLALSVVIILFVTPASLFSVGFQLSVCAVGGIILLSKQIMRILKKLPRRLAETISVCVAAQAGTLPVLLANFGYISGAGLVLNLIVVPVLSVIFVLLFICTLIALALPFSASYLLTAAALPLQAVVSFFIDSGLERALISGFGSGAFTAIYFIGLILLSDKINLKASYRISAVVCTACALCILATILN